MPGKKTLVGNTWRQRQEDILGCSKTIHISANNNRWDTGLVKRPDISGDWVELCSSYGQNSTNQVMKHRPGVAGVSSHCLSPMA